MIRHIDTSLLKPCDRRVSVAMLDSGYTSLPRHSVLYGGNSSSVSHGDRILSIFCSPDASFPIGGLSLRLACYSPASGYDGLVHALKTLPPSDMLSISMSWRYSNSELEKLLKERFGVVCCPYSPDGSLPYPASYGFTVTCSNTDNPLATHSIRPNAEWRGNSYAVPAVARLLAYGVPMESLSVDEGGMAVEEFFGGCSNGVRQQAVSHGNGKMMCPHCGRYVRHARTHGFVIVEHGTPCPCCGLPL